MAPRLYKVAEVCDLLQVQSYVLRSWEKEFPGIGLQRTADGPRLYRQSDVDQVLRIKQLVFGEGLTLAGARRRLEEDAADDESTTDSEVAEVLEALASDARVRIAHVRDGLRSILKVLSKAPGTVVIVDDDFHLDPPPMNAAAQKARSAPARSSSRATAEREGRSPARRAKQTRATP